VIELLGWLATGVFISSYFFTRPSVLRGVQVGGAALWTIYGVFIGAPPVIVANLLVGAVACWTALRSRRMAAPAASSRDTRSV
jgi:hypothetical protein